MKVLSNILLAGIIMMIIGCQNQDKKPPILKTEITKDNLPKLADSIDKNTDLTIEQLDHLAQGITRLTIEQDTLTGKTLDYVLEKQKEYVKKQNVSGLKNNFNRVALIMNHNFKYLGIQPKTMEDKEWDLIVYQVENLSEKPIKELEGNLQFFTMNNQLVKRYPLRTSVGMNDEVVKPGETKRIALPYVHDSENVRDSVMRYGNKTLKSAWYPETIIFEDGSKITVSKQQNDKKKKMK